MRVSRRKEERKWADDHAEKGVWVAGRDTEKRLRISLPGGRMLSISSDENEHWDSCHALQTPNPLDWGNPRFLLPQESWAAGVGLTDPTRRGARHICV